MKQHGYLFKAAMVLALMRDVDPKRQTRRPITFDNSTTDGLISRKEWPDLRWEEATFGEEVMEGALEHLIPVWTVPFRNITVKVYPRVRPGDVLWVRETWAMFGTSDSITPPVPRSVQVYYLADNSTLWKPIPVDAEIPATSLKHRPGIHMYRWASRIDLKVLKMRSQRVQEITGNDAIEEGCCGYKVPEWKEAAPLDYCSPQYHFMVLWDSINAARGFSWVDNHPVWIHDFERIKSA